MKMAMDQELRHVDRGEVAEQLLALRNDIEQCMEKLDLHDTVKHELFQCLNKHVRPGEHSKRGPGPAWHERQRQARDQTPLHEFLRQKGLAEHHVAEAARLAEEHPRPSLRRAAGEGRDEPDHEGLRRLLKEKGVSEDEIGEAFEIITGGGEATDRFPITGPAGHGGRMAKGFRESAHMPTFRSREDQHRLDALDAINRIGFVAGERVSSGRRMSKREKRIAFDNARAAASGLDSPFAEINENVNNILSGRVGRA
jgi:hypothetical protein